MKASSLPNLDRETTSFPNFLTLFQDPSHHDDTTLDKRPTIHHSEASETSPFKYTLSPSVNTSSMVNFPPLEENQAVKRLKQFSGNVGARLEGPSFTQLRWDQQTLTNTSSVGSNHFSGDVGARSESEGTSFTQLRWDNNYLDFPEDESTRVLNEQLHVQLDLFPNRAGGLFKKKKLEQGPHRHGFSFTEISAVRASGSKVVCCQFSSDGKLLASGGHDKKIVLWSTDTLKVKSTLEEHSSLITDVRFSPSMPRLATSSFDKTVRVWDADNPGYSIRTFTGHYATVFSLDFHPNKEDLICSCDGDREIRYWSINNGTCQRVFKGGTTQVRFQPRLGRYLAAAAENVVSIIDVETQALRHSLPGHTKPIDSICWDPCGEWLASVSEDSVRVWTFGSGSEGDCIHELSRNDGNKFCSCFIHPSYASLLVIGCYQSLVLWNMIENKIMILPAHDGLIAGLAVSPVTGLVASASHDKFVKLWK
ncbi:hypothetical protein Vadar_032596 [Vaccinium darrowii]|uniref:Uncharacterized protein n=1 Tax=Vaccinium darrowii TaxID=229202 RepID=A0ACB7Y392_9ERIC|nr:hypothetical protein Vadar_032596 [Vaccinium darrowii]